MNDERRTKFVRGRVTPKIKALIDDLIDEHNTTAEDLLGELATWFATQPRSQQKQIVVHLSDDDVLGLARKIEERRRIQETAAAAQQEPKVAHRTRKSQGRRSSSESG